MDDFAQHLLVGALCRRCERPQARCLGAADAADRAARKPRSSLAIAMPEPLTKFARRATKSAPAVPRAGFLGVDERQGRSLRRDDAASYLEEFFRHRCV